MPPEIDYNALAEMSDEDFLKTLDGATGTPAEPGSTVSPEAAPPAVEAPAPAAVVAPVEPVVAPDAVAPVVAAPAAAAPAAPAAPVDPAVAAPGTPDPNAPATPAPAADTEAAPAAEIDYKAFYETLTAEFKANGKKVQLRSPEEAVRLMQKGAGYSQAMQQLAPHRKLLMTLENAGLMDEGKLNFLIDLHNRKPEAIAHLMKESQIDPLSLDTSENLQYSAGNHTVTDAELHFRTALDEVSSSPEGAQTVQIVNSAWDNVSKEELWKNPQLLGVIHEQRQSGIYDRIVAEMEHQRMLGTLPASAPFIHAYHQVGAWLQAQAALPSTPAAPAAAPAAPAAQAPRVVAVRAEAPSHTVPAAAKAAGAPPKAPVAPATTLQSLLDLDDKAFLAEMAKRTG